MFVKIFLIFWLTVGALAALQEGAVALARHEEQRGLAAVRTAVADARPVLDAFNGGGATAAGAAIAVLEGRGAVVELLDQARRPVAGREPGQADLDLARLADRIAAAGLPNAAVNFQAAIAAQRVVAASGQPMTLVVHLPPSAVAARWGVRTYSVWARLAVVFAVGGILCFALAQHLSGPVVALTGAAEAIAEGRLSTRVGDAVAARHDEVGALARNFDRMAARVEGLMAAQQQLLADVSHELRSPLARLSIALALARQQASPEAHEYFARMDGEIDRLERLIEQLLMLSRVESGIVRDTSERVDLAALVREVVGDCDFEARATGRRVTLAHTAEVEVEGVLELLRRAIENVVRNAVRFTPPATSVEVTLAVDAQTAQIRIRDHGPGLDPALAAELFKPFRRGLSAMPQSSGGVGLGLAITARILHMHHGDVRVANAGDGLTVTLELQAIRSA